MKNDIIVDQLCRYINLLPEHLSAAILAGNMPPTEEIVMALIISAMDAHAVTLNDPQATWIDKRAARMALAGVILAAMAVLGEYKESV